MTDLLFHIATETDWAGREDVYVPSQFASEGFIHCSTAMQLERVASQRFRLRDDLVVLSIDPDRVGPQIRYENLEGGQEQFPHIYGPLNLDAVFEVRHVRTDHNGKFIFAPDGKSSEL